MKCTSYNKESENVKEEIVLQCGFLGVDYLLMGSRGLDKIPKMVLGSTSEYCVVHAPCPVMIVKKEGWKNEPNPSDQW
jgi:nucleotide-binding universal stress UspA family protein